MIMSTEGLCHHLVLELSQRALRQNVGVDVLFRGVQPYQNLSMPGVNSI